MLKKIINTVAIAAFAAVLVAMATPAKAGLYPNPHPHFDYTGLVFTTTIDTPVSHPSGLGMTVGSFDIQDSAMSMLTVLLRDGDGEPIDNEWTMALAMYNPFDVLLSGEIIRTSGDGTDGNGTYVLLGTLTATDVNGTDVLLANFRSTYLDVSQGSNYKLDLEGALSSKTPVPGTILVTPNPGDDWTFVGAFGATTSITVPAPLDNFDGGDVMEYHQGGFVLSDLIGLTPTLDDFFSESFDGIQGGDMKVTVVPVPAAVILGLFGLGLVGTRMRKYA